MRLRLKHRRIRLIAALVSVAWLVRSADALVIRYPDGSVGNGCGVVNYMREGVPPAKPAAPIVLPRSYVSASGWFRIHYGAVSGDRNAVPLSDKNGNGIPDWVELVASAADSILTTYRALGYTNSLNDGGTGGGPEYDIYLSNLSPQGVYGLTWPGPDGYMQMDNDYAESIYETNGEAGMRVTLAHEMFHAVQFTYWVGGNEVLWWQEATAVFMEEIVYPQINDYLQYLNPNYFCSTLFEDPSLPLHYSSTSSCDAHMYGVAVFCHFLNESNPAHGQEAIRYSFERQRDLRSGDLSVVIRALEAKMDQPIRDLLATFWVWSYFSGSRARPGLFFHEASAFSSPPPSKVSPEKWVVENLSAKGSVQGSADASGLGAWIIRFAPDRSVGGLRLHLAASGATADQWAWRVAVADRDSVRIFAPHDGEVLVSNWDAASDVVLVGANGSLLSQRSEFSYTATYDRELTRPAPEALELVLGQNRPNPFNTRTAFPFHISASAAVTAIVYDVAGRSVRTILASEPFGSGDHTVEWDGFADDGKLAGTGLYLLHVRTGNVARSRRMILLR